MCCGLVSFAPYFQFAPFHVLLVVTLIMGVAHCTKKIMAFYRAWHINTVFLIE